MTVRVRFAPSPTGSLHVGSALTAAANRRFADERGGVLLLRIDDTDPTRVEAGAEERILADLEWLGIRCDEGPVRQSDRGDLYRGAAQRLLESGEAVAQDGSVRFGGEGRPTLLRPDGTATYQLASVVDDVDLEITHVIRGKDHLANAGLHAALTRALGADPPEYLHHGLLVGEDGTKLSKRQGSVSVADLRERGIPPEAVRRYLDELGLPRGDVHYDEARVARLSVEAIAAFSDEELARRAGAPLRVIPALRGAHTLVEASGLAEALLSRPPAAPTRSPETLERFRAAREAAPDELDRDTAGALVAALREQAGDLRALRRALTGEDRGPDLPAVLVALPRAEALARIDASLRASP